MASDALTVIFDSSPHGPLRFSCQNWISETGLSNATVAIIEADKESEEV